MDTAILRGAWDVHVHIGPDIVERAQTFFEYGRDAAEAGMAGVVLKDHCGSTFGAASVLNQVFPMGPRFFGSLTLNRPVGGINPVGVEEGLGMRTMRHRASIIGGSLTLGESSEGGVVVQCRVPAPPRR